MARKRYNLRVISSISIRPELLHLLDVEADMKDVSRSRLIEDILEEHYKEAEDGRKKETPIES